MESPFRQKIRADKLASLPVNAVRLYITLVFLLLSSSLLAQSTTARVEFATLLQTSELRIHVRVLPDKSLESARVEFDTQAVELEVQALPLETVQWVLLDAGERMINLQPAVQAAIQHLLRNTDTPTGLIYYDDIVRILEPTQNAADIDAFLAQYNATAGKPACLGDAIDSLAQLERAGQQSWRILLITGQLSDQTQCQTDSLGTLPAAPEIVVVADSVDEQLRDWAADNAGSVITANLRTLESRVADVRTLWDRSSYLLHTIIRDDVLAQAELLLRYADGEQESISLRLANYNIPVPPEPLFTPTIPPSLTPTPTDTNTPPPTVTTTTTFTPEPTATLPPTSTATFTDLPIATNTPTIRPSAEVTVEETEALVIAIPSTPTTAVPQATPETAQVPPVSGPNQFSLVLVFGSLLFVLVMVMLAVALPRRGAKPEKRVQGSSESFYESLEQTPMIPNPTSQIRKLERKNIQDAAAAGTKQLGDSEKPEAGVDTHLVETALTKELTDSEEEDALTLTRVLSDAAFRKMMEDSRKDRQIVAWLHLDSISKGDFELTPHGAIVGRSMDCDIQIKGDSAISRQHARFAVQEDGSIVVSRLSAVNPVVVAGIQVSNRHVLRSKDVIHLSDRTRLIIVANQEDDSA